MSALVITGLLGPSPKTDDVVRVCKGPRMMRARCCDVTSSLVMPHLHEMLGAYFTNHPVRIYLTFAKVMGTRDRDRLYARVRCENLQPELHHKVSQNAWDTRTRDPEQSPSLQAPISHARVHMSPQAALFGTASLRAWHVREPAAETWRAKQA